MDSESQRRTLSSTPERDAAQTEPATATGPAYRPGKREDETLDDAGRTNSKVN